MEGAGLLQMNDTKSSQEYVKWMLEELKNSKGRWSTLVALARSDTWQDCSVVYKESTKLSHHGTNYVFEIAGKYPSVVQLSADKKQIRLKPEIRLLVRRLLK